MRSLLQQLQDEKRFVSAPCGGYGKCGKCAVRFVYGATEATVRDREIFTKEQLEDGWRLACLSYPEGDYEVELSDAEDQIVAELSYQKEDSGQNPAAGMTAEEKRLDGQTVSSGEDEEHAYGIAVDIGTTTIAGLLVDLKTGKILQAASQINHQRTYGADVLSRIQASVDGKRWEMQRCIRQDLKKLIAELTRQVQDQMQEKIKHIVIAGNTTMCHLLRGFSCEKLGVAPFIPVDIGIMKGCAKELLGFREMEAKVTILPGFSAFVGADITAGAALLGMGTTRAYTLLLDIGTNGEMVLGNKDGLYAASTSAGPAFEGGNIACGMASVSGAISHVTLDERKQAEFKVIGARPIAEERERVKENECSYKQPSEKVLGICGSGMVDLYAELKRHAIIDAYGTYTDAYFDQGYVLTDRVKFTQKDIRELQMAKAAIRAGIEILMAKAAIRPEEIERCYLAGGFGSQIDIANAAEIGLIPQELTGKTVAAGNTALEGARQYLLGNITDGQLEALKAATKEVNLANEEAFDDFYIQYM